jgi:universal stress protein A
MKPTILVPFDFSDTAERALAWAADLQRTTGGPPIHMVHAISLRPAGTSEVDLGILLPNADEIAQLERRMTETAVRHEAKADATVLIRASNLSDIILDAARELGVELIVMGSHGRTGVRRLLLGSVTEHTVRHAACPVVTVHAPR